MARAQFSAETSADGAFVRQPNRFTGRVTADSDSPPGGGPDARGRWPLEAGRYRLVWCQACPWAHRAAIVRGLLGLDEAIGLATVDPIRDERGWRFTLDPGGRDPVLGIAYLSEAYLATDPGYAGRVTVPALVDTLTGQVVSNDYPQLTLDLSTQWRSLHRAGAPELYPAELRVEMDALMADVHRDVNNGVYRCGFATSQAAYDEAFTALFARLDALSERLSGQRYLMGDAITEADVRLFTTLVRFDAAYHGHFKCNRHKLTELPVLWAYARDLFQTPGFGDTVNFDHIKRHYYGTHPAINPTGIVPLGPDTAGWATPHGRG
ncbi:glutathione S-transferase [Micromonospora sp. ATCC 39149]|uniref:Glutathione S-transferase C-terminal domain-containing protein n=1 Tax=Micromonospora carbonacea TaxID=47853 RepID=A0A7D6CFX8_9ACTN|nr:glutathione S-transferase C-terminal domain-containing protein [Micromonospora sp. ATCC 39149]EEP73997.1 glutathione S-transferase [Micromonospora sp. ATCC 39149]QLJ99871.1 glutathione S-transferase C-terminal domain-containing protein [Micromonospora carbonacea]